MSNLILEERDESKAWQLVRPGEDYQDIQIKEIYELAPFPHGTSRQTVAEILSSLKWEARVLQPGKSSRTHMSWKVGSSTAPPSSVLQSGETDIIVTQLRQPKQIQEQPNTIASWKTQTHLRAGKTDQARSSKDPWMESGNDPWANFKPNTASQAQERKYLDEVTDVLNKSIEDQVKKQYEVIKENFDQHMLPADDATEDHALRSTIQELQNQNVQFQQWFHEATAKIQEVESTSRDTQAALHAQQQELQSMRSEMQQQATQTGLQMQQALVQVKRDIVQDLAEQNNKHFAQLEAMLAKKARSNE